jgi:hypothetical protein
MAGTRHQKSKQRAFKLAPLVPPHRRRVLTGNALFSNLTFGHDALGAMHSHGFYSSEARQGGQI